MLVRILVGATLGRSALVACAVLHYPGDLPAVALGQPGIYRLEVALVVLLWLSPSC